MKTKFTPGPWNMQENAGWSISSEKNWLFHDSEEVEKPIERKANARLVSYAPDLYEQLSDLLDYLGKDWNDYQEVKNARMLLRKINNL